LLLDNETVFVVHNILKHVPRQIKLRRVRKMGAEAKSRSRRAKVVLMICVVLVVLLSVSNVMFFNTTQSLQNLISTLDMQNSDLRKEIDTLQTRNTNLQSQISSLQSQINNLKSQINSLKTQNDQLQSQEDVLRSEVDALQTQNSRLQNEIEALKAPQLHEVDVRWTDHERYPSPYVSIQGSIFNSGSETAYNAILTVRIFDRAGTLLKSEEIHLGTIDGKSYIAFNVEIPYSGDADSVTTTLTYD